MRVYTDKQQIDYAEQDKIEVANDRTTGLLAIKELLFASAAFDPGSIAADSFITQTITVTGAALGDFAIASFSLDLSAGINMMAYVNAADTVTVYMGNETAGAIDLGPGTLRAAVIKL